MNVRPLAIDLFCGLGGFTEGLLAEGYNPIGFDIEAHDYGDGKRYPAQLVIQDVLTLHGRQLKDAALIVASPPCQFFSYCAMPWSRAKKLAAEVRASKERTDKELALFRACFRIQREAIEAAGHFIPMVVENVRGAQPWVGRAKWNFGSYFLWGDVPALMPIPGKRVGDSVKAGDRNKGAANGEHKWTTSFEPTEGFKTSGMNWSDRSIKGQDFTRIAGRQADGVKFSQSGDAWFDGTPRDKMLGEKGPAAHGSKSNARKAASAQIAKIPLSLASWIARVYKPRLTT